MREGGGAMKGDGLPTAQVQKKKCKYAEILFESYEFLKVKM